MIQAGCVLVLQLRLHRRSVRFAQSGQFRRLRTNLNPTVSAVETDPHIVHSNRVAIHVVDDSGVDVVDRTVIKEVAGVPVPALVAGARIAEPVVDAAVEADMRPPIAAEVAITAMHRAPVAGSPERTLIRCLHPHARNPVVARRSPAPVPGGPEIVIAGRGRLIVFGQGRRWVGSGSHGLLAVV